MNANYPDPMSEITRETRHLLTALCEGELADAQAFRLEELVAENEEACWYYVRAMHLHGALPRLVDRKLADDEDADLQEPAIDAQESAVRNIDEQLFAALEDSQENPLPEGDGVSRERYLSWDILQRPIGLSVAAALGVTVVVLLVLAVWVAPSFRGRAVVEVPPAAPVGRLSGIVNVKWAQDAKAWGLGDVCLANEEIHLTEGLVEIEFFQGAKAVVEGPVTLRIDGPNAGFLESGRLYAHVPRQAVGFCVETPSVRLVDLGTEFGVEVDAVSKQTDLAVYAGKVEAEMIAVGLDDDSHEATAKGKQTVTAGQALRFRAKTGATTIPRGQLTGRFARSVFSRHGGVCANLKVKNPSFEEPDIRKHPQFVASEGHLPTITAPGWQAALWRNRLGYEQGRCTLAPYPSNEGKRSQGNRQDTRYGPAATDGKQVVKMLVAQRGQYCIDDITHTWLFQTLGVVGEVDVGKTLDLVVDVAARSQYPPNVRVLPKDGATVTATFALDVSRVRCGEVVGQPGRNVKLLRSDGTQVLHARLKIGREHVGRRLAILLSVEEPEPSEGYGSHYHFDNVRCEVSQ